MLKQNYFLEIEKEDKKYKFEFHQEATLGSLFDVLTQMRGYVIARIDEVNAQAESKEESVETEEVKDGREDS